MKKNTRKTTARDLYNRITSGLVLPNDPGLDPGAFYMKEYPALEDSRGAVTGE